MRDRLWVSSLLVLGWCSAAVTSGCSSSPPPMPEKRPTADVTQPKHNVMRVSALQPVTETPRLEDPAGESPPAIRPFAEWSEQDVAADTLGRIGPAAVPALRQALQSPDAAVRLRAVEVLGRMGSDAKEAVPDLTALLNDADPRIRKAATRTLGRIGPAAEEAVPALMRALLTPQ